MAISEKDVPLQNHLEVRRPNIFVGIVISNSA